MAANTDKVTLLNGDIITCEIQRLERGILRVGTDSMGDLDIEWTDVVGITSEQHLLIETAEGIRYFGRLTGSDDPAFIKVQITEKEVREVARVQVVLITPIEEKLRDRLDLDLSLGYSYTVITSYSIHYTKLYDNSHCARGHQVPLYGGHHRSARGAYGALRSARLGGAASRQPVSPYRSPGNNTVGSKRTVARSDSDS